jgi:hypothetical protein
MNDLQSRAAAVRELLKRGLAATAEPATNRVVNSKSYRVVRCRIYSAAANNPNVEQTAEGEGVDPS